jgi:hypothetical protein
LWWRSPKQDERLTPDELKSAIGFRAQDLWVEAGRPPERKPDQFQSEIHEGEFYRFKRGELVFIYRRDPTANTKEALAVFGLAAGFKEIFTSTGTAPHGGEAAAAIPWFAKGFAGIELFLIFLSGASILVSMAFGLSLLSSLPGAAQRLPANEVARQSGIFSGAGLDRDRSSFVEPGF